MAQLPIGFLPHLPSLARRGEGGTETSSFSVRSAAFTVAAGDRILADMTGGAWTMKLPPAAAPGAGFELLTYGSNLLTVDRNGNPIAGIADDGAIPGGSNAHMTWVYLNATYGWIYGGAL